MTPIWCPSCDEEHPASAFGREKRRASGLTTICRDARRAERQTTEAQETRRQRHAREWADPHHRTRSLASARARRRLKGQEDLRKARRRLQDIIDAWKARGCVDCGWDDIRAIDPDHRDGEVKAGNLSRLVTLCASADRIRAELAKCDPRCARCHRLRTAHQRPNSWRELERVPPSWQQRLKLQQLNDRIKTMHGCADCGWAEWSRGLDWDHVRGIKGGSIATMIANRRLLKELFEEMAKCDVVCANCHRIRTAVRAAAGRAC